MRNKLTPSLAIPKDGFKMHVVYFNHLAEHVILHTKDNLVHKMHFLKLGFIL